MSTDASSETAGSTGTETAPPLVFDDDGLPVDNTHVPDEDTGMILCYAIVS